VLLISINLYGISSEISRIRKVNDHPSGGSPLATGNPIMTDLTRSIGVHHHDHQSRRHGHGDQPAMTGKPGNQPN